MHVQLQQDCIPRCCPQGQILDPSGTKCLRDLSKGTVHKLRKTLFIGMAKDLEGYIVVSREIQIIHRLFLVIAMYCQASSMNHYTSHVVVDLRILLSLSASVSLYTFLCSN